MSCESPLTPKCVPLGLAPAERDELGLTLDTISEALFHEDSRMSHVELKRTGFEALGARAQTRPPVQSAWPEKNFVAEWIWWQHLGSDFGGLKLREVHGSACGAWRASRVGFLSLEIFASGYGAFGNERWAG